MSVIKKLSYIYDNDQTGSEIRTHNLYKISENYGKAEKYFLENTFYYTIRSKITLDYLLQLHVFLEVLIFLIEFSLEETLFLKKNVITDFTDKT